MLVSHDQNEHQNQDIKIGNRSTENVSQFEYFGTAVTDQNLIEEEIKGRLKSGNVCYYNSALNLPSSHLLLKNIKLDIQDYSLPVILYRREPWSLSLGEGHK
jgi:hypothetical protein